MCKPIFETGKDVVLGSGFYEAKGIIAIESKGVYMSALIMKQHYWSKVFTRDPIYVQFKYKKVGDVDMLESKHQENKIFQIFCLKYPEYVTNIMACWMSIDDLRSQKQEDTSWTSVVQEKKDIFPLAAFWTTF